MVLRIRTIAAHLEPRTTVLGAPVERRVMQHLHVLLPDFPLSTRSGNLRRYSISRHLWFDVLYASSMLA